MNRENSNESRFSHPNIIICMCDQLRAFEVHCYGNDGGWDRFPIFIIFDCLKM